VFTATADGTVNVHLTVPGGLTNGDKVKWIWNNGGAAPTTVFTDTVAGTSYNATKAISLNGARGYVRVEITNSAGTSLRAVTQAILFADVAGLPAGMSYHVERVTTPNGAGYTKTMTKGITASSYDATARTLSATLTDPAGSLVELRGTMPTGFTPQTVSIDGTPATAAASLAAFNAATGSSWFFDGTPRALYVKASQAGGTASVVVDFGANGDAQAPSIPGGLAAVAAGATRVDLSWAASSDNVGVTGYTVFRNGQAIATPAGTTFSDTGLSAGTAYTYTVDAFDAAGNHSAPSSPATATTAAAGTASFAPAADAYTVATSPNSNFGSATSLRTDASPETRSYLRFAVTGLTGTVTNATLRVFATSANSVGYSAYRVGNVSWGETALTFANQPAPDATALGSTGSIAAGTWTNVDVTPLVTGNGAVGVALLSTSSTALSLSSRTGANPPQLVVTTDPGSGGGDGQAPSVPTGVAAVASSPTAVNVSWTASTDNVGVTGYTVYRNNVAVANPTTPGFADTGLSPSTTYAYTVDAVDAAGNRSAVSTPAATVTTPPTGGGTTTTPFAAVADDYTIATSPSTNFGTAVQVRVDNDPDTRAYLKFTVAGLTGAVSGAKLRIFTNTANTTGFKVYAVADSTWTERGLTYATQPAPSTTVSGSSGATTAGAYIDVDLGSLITGNGTYTLALRSTSNTAQSLASRESASPPQLVVTSG
jgi:chitodextrinase